MTHLYRRGLSVIALAALSLALARPTHAEGPCGVPQVRPVPPEGQAAVQRYEPTTRGVARDLAVPQDLIERVVWVESRGDPLAESSAGAKGLTQVMPFHWATGENWRDPGTNVRKGASLLRQAFDTTGDWVLASVRYGGTESYKHLIFWFNCDPNEQSKRADTTGGK